MQVLWEHKGGIIKLLFVEHLVYDRPGTSTRHFTCVFVTHAHSCPVGRHRALGSLLYLLSKGAGMRRWRPAHTGVTVSSVTPVLILDLAGERYPVLLCSP